MSAVQTWAVVLAAGVVLAFAAGAAVVDAVLDPASASCRCCSVLAARCRRRRGCCDNGGAP